MKSLIIGILSLLGILAIIALTLYSTIQFAGAAVSCEFVSGQWSRYCPVDDIPLPPSRPYPYNPHGEPRTGRGGVYQHVVTPPYSGPPYILPEH